MSKKGRNSKSYQPNNHKSFIGFSSGTLENKSDPTTNASPVNKVDNTTPLRELFPTAKVVYNWKELSEIPNESETHFLKVEEYSGWLTCKKEEIYDRTKDWLSQASTLDHYLSTHTFYGDSPKEKRKHYQYRASTRIMQACGFNVIIAGDYNDEEY